MRPIFIWSKYYASKGLLRQESASTYNARQNLHVDYIQKPWNGRILQEIPFMRDIMIHKLLQVVKRHIRSFYVEVQSQCLNCELCLCLSDPICIRDLNHKSSTKHVCLNEQTILQQLMNHFLRINLICKSFKIITPLHSNSLLILDSP